MRLIFGGGRLNVDEQLSRMSPEQFDEVVDFVAIEGGDPWTRILHCLARIGVALSTPPEECKGEMDREEWAKEMFAHFAGAPVEEETPQEITPQQSAMIARFEVAGR